MINPILIQRRQRRYKPKLSTQTPTPPPPGAPLNLVSSGYQIYPVVAVTLGFDRAVDVSGFEGSAIEVFDGNATQQTYLGATASLVDDATVKVVLASRGSDTDYGIYMNATAASGIVAVNDGGTWAGVDGLVLPDPPAPAQLNLQTVNYVVGPDYVQITLGFDRAIDVSALNGSAIVVSDGDVEYADLAATGDVVMIDPATVQIGLVSIGSEPNPGVYLNATADSGIVAVDDGGTWAGVSGYVLPDPVPVPPGGDEHV